MKYINSHGCWDRDRYEEYIGGSRAYGPEWLCRTLGPISRFCLDTVPRKLDNWLKEKDVAMDALLQPSPVAHKTMPKAIFLQSVVAGMRGFQRRVLKPWVLMTAGLALGMGVASLFGAGVLLAGIAGLAALPLSTAVAGVGLTAFGGAVRAAVEVPRAIANIHVGYGRRAEYYETLKEEEDRAYRQEKETLTPLCRVLHDDEREAAKASPQERANWLCALAKQFPEEFLEAAKRSEKPELPKPGIKRVGDMKGLQI